MLSKLLLLASESTGAGRGHAVTYYHALRRRDRLILRVDLLHDVGYRRLQLPAGPVPHAVRAKQGVQSSIYSDGECLRKQYRSTELLEKAQA